MIKHQLIFLLLALPLLGYQVPQNQMADVSISTLTNEQKASTYNLAKSIGSHSYTSKIKLIFDDGSSSNYKIDYLLTAFKNIAQDAEKSDGPDKLTKHLKLNTRLKIKEIKGVKLFILAKDGEKIIKFESAGLRIGKRMIGPFEVPSNKNLIISPKITYY
jgi:hypothetical protein